MSTDPFRGSMSTRAMSHRRQIEYLITVIFTACSYASTDTYARTRLGGRDELACAYHGPRPPEPCFIAIDTIDSNARFCHIGSKQCAGTVTAHRYTCNTKAWRYHVHRGHVYGALLVAELVVR